MSDSHRRRLPHHYPPGHPIFLTFRINSPLSSEILGQIKTNFEFERKAIDTEQNPVLIEILLEKLKKKYFFITDQAYDKQIPVSVNLALPNITEIVSKSLLFYDNKSWEVFCFSVMPNHVHILLSLMGHKRDYEERKSTLSVLSENLKIIKGYTAREINKLLGTKGSIWMREYFDTMIRTEKQFCSCVMYILRNPVKAGLTADIFSWYGNYYNENKIREYTGLRIAEMNELYV